MTPGTVLFDEKFIFADGQEGRKIIIALNDGQHYPYIVVKTTSQGRRYNIEAFCQNQDYFPNFYLPRGCCHLQKDTWIQLDEYFEYDRAFILNGQIEGKITRQAVIPSEIFKKLIICAIESDDITGEHEEELKKMFHAYCYHE